MQVVLVGFDDPVDPFEIVNGPFSGDMRSFSGGYLLKNTPDWSSIWDLNWVVPIPNDGGKIQVVLGIPACLRMYQKSWWPLNGKGDGPRCIHVSNSDI